MKNLTIDLFYNELEKHVLLVEAYTEIKDLALTIKACRLKPYGYFFEQKTAKIILYKWWFDEFNNSLKINNKNINIVYNDLSLNSENIICTDLYAGLSVEKVAKLSKLVYIACGKDEDLQQDYCHMTFLGIDNYFRSYTYIYGEWQKVSPLVLGIDKLINIIKHNDINYFKKLMPQENKIHPCPTVEEWLSSTTMISGFLDTINNDIVKSIFN